MRVRSSCQIRLLSRAILLVYTSVLVYGIYYIRDDTAADYRLPDYSVRWLRVAVYDSNTANPNINPKPINNGWRYASSSRTQAWVNHSVESVANYTDDT